MVENYSEKRAHIELHIAVFLFGFTAILGAIIDLPALVLVWWRVLLASISFLFIVKWWYWLKVMPRKVIWQIMGIGCIVAVHWLAFYGSIKLSSPSIALICMATATFFTAFLEPYIMGGKVKRSEVLLGLLIVPGMALVVNGVENTMYLGIIVGIISAFLAALFSTLNKKMISHTSPLMLSWLEMSSSCLFLSLLLPVFYYYQPDAPFLPKDGTQWLWMGILVLLCTTMAYSFMVRSLQVLSAFSANLALDLEPVYGIILGVLLLNENKQLNATFYLGAAVILAALFIHAWMQKKAKKKAVAQ